MITARGGFRFNDVLPRLVAAYESGRLVPFIGAGMSRPMCSAWWELISALEARAETKVTKPITRHTKPAKLVERANLAIARLRFSSVGALAAAIDESLFTKNLEIPPQTAALAAMRWPLVLSTNYDNAFVAAHEREFGADSIAVAGRGAEDCQRVLNSLSTAGRSLLWALQGHIAQPFAVHSQARDARLRSEVVIDYTEYRRVTYSAPHFRRAFAEVFRHRSLFFLGSGLRESYLHELFGEVLEIYGPNTRTHFAIIPKGEVDPRFMYDRFQIVVVEWQLEVSPPPTTNRADFEHETITDKLDWTLDRLLVPPGGTLHFRRVFRTRQGPMAEIAPAQAAATNSAQPVQVRSLPPVIIH